MELWLVNRENEFKEISHLVKDVIIETQSPFQKIRVLDTWYFSRILVLDNQIQSAEYDEYVYHEALVHPAMVTHNRPENILILGGGEGATLREVLRYGTVKDVTMVEIDEKLLEVSKEYLSNWHRGAFDDPRTNILIIEASEFLKTTDKKFDVIICDINDPVEGGPAAAVYTQEFYQSVGRVLSKDGIFVSQAVEISYDENDLHSILSRTLSHTFRICESYCEYIPSFGAMWGFLLGSNRLSGKKVSMGEIEKRLTERSIEGLRFYDAETHRRLFNLPKMVRHRIADQKKISTIQDPVKIFEG
ncbi:MAG: polyamine aminopropyltransferase [Pseudomonadota bacterium]